jgi:ribA/ribD-fused uncharacterized protein
MVVLHPTHREADGERVPGSRRPAFIRNGDTYFLTDVVVYADGLIDCWGLVTVDEFAEKLRCGWVATEFEEGARASAHQVGEWRFAEPYSYTTADALLGEVRDEIEELNGRPTSTDRCHAALDAFLADPAEDNRAALRAAYFAMPETVRVYVLGDMDNKDRPLRVLAAGPGGTLPDGDGPFGEEDHAAAWDYFERERRDREEYARTPRPDDDREPSAAAITLRNTVYPRGWPEEPGTLVLRNEYPAPVTVDGAEYPTVVHAYWALSVADPDTAEAVRTADTHFAARDLAARGTRREGWDDLRPAVMARLLRAKFDQHPEFARVLMDTGDAALRYEDAHSPRYWGQQGLSGRNWAGRLLELVRSELRARAAGVPV